MMPNDMKNAHDLGYLSTSEMCRTFGVTMSHTWITSVLKIQPTLYLRGGLGIYWSKEKAAEVREALIAHLVSGRDPSQHPPKAPNLPFILMSLEHWLDVNQPEKLTANAVSADWDEVHEAWRILQEAHIDLGHKLSEAVGEENPQ